MPRIFFFNISLDIRTFITLRTAAQLLCAKRYAAPSQWTQTKRIDTHSDRFSQKTNLYSDTRNAQILYVDIFQFVFRADHTATAQARGQKSFHFQMRTLMQVYYRFDIFRSSPFRIDLNLCGHS
jgi:hypothetical protein